MKDAATTNEQPIDNNYFYEKITFSVVAAVVPHVVVNVTPGMIYQQ